MIVIGVDPGARATGIAVVDAGAYGRGEGGLLGSTTVDRDPSSPILDVEVAYLVTVASAVRDLAAQSGAQLVAVEGVRRPSWHVARGSRSGRGGAAADPSAIIATGIVLGAILTTSGVPLVVVEPGKNGSRPLDQYPEALRPTRGTGRGTDKLRHERSAYDVAIAGPGYRKIAAARRTIYA